MCVHACVSVHVQMGVLSLHFIGVCTDGRLHVYVCMSMHICELWRERNGEIEFLVLKTKSVFER